MVVPGFDFGEQGVSSEDGDVAGAVEDGDVWSSFERLRCWWFSIVLSEK